MTKSLIWCCEKMIHAYVCIHMAVLDAWRNYRDQRKSMCARSSHRIGNGNNCQPLYREYMKGEEGVLGG